ncbi:MAG TPA: hypothetical protein VHJ20_22370 [Polyangia bacterium]|nr:hypothetical protein [Polyangia bacterium]
MNKLNLSIGVLLIGSLLGACSKSDSGTGNTGGTTGGGGSTGGSTGSGGTVANGGSTGAGGNYVVCSGCDSGAPATKTGGGCKDNAYPHTVAGVANVCVCQSGTPKACDTMCTDITTDTDNCGACNTKCATNATCVASKCGVAPTVAVQKPATTCKGLWLTSTTGSLTWSDTGAGKVFTMSTSGTGTPMAVSGTETTAPKFVQVVGTSTFWLDGDMTIRMAKAGTVTTVTTSATKINGFVASADAATVYFSTGSTVMSVAATGGATTKVAEENNEMAGVQQGVPLALGLGTGANANLLAYGTDINGDVDIVTISADKTKSALCVASPGEEPAGFTNVMCARIARSQGSLNQTVIIPSGNNVYWIDGRNLHLNAFSANAAQSNKTVASADNAISSMVLGTDAIYFTSFDPQDPTTGVVQKTGLAEASPIVPLARNINGPSSIAADGKKVFFATADCEIQTLTAP